MRGPSARKSGPGRRHAPGDGRRTPHEPEGKLARKAYRGHAGLRHK